VLSAENAQAQTASTPSGYDTLQEFTITPADESPSSLGLPSQLNLFCVELGQDSPGTGTQPSPTTYTILPIASADMNNASGSVDAYAGIPASGIGTGTGLMLEQLYGYVFPSYTGSSPLNISFGALTLTGGSGAAYDSAVFQLAAWQIAETGGFSSIRTSGPGFFVSSAPGGLVQDADTLLAAVAADSNVTPLNLDALHSDSGQDFILPDPSGSFIAIPEPGTYAAVLGTAALGFALFRRRRTAQDGLAPV
jgi:hypothetical protein